MTATDHDQDRPDEISMTLPAIEVRNRMAHQWATSHGQVPWTVTQHFYRDVPALLADLERLRADAERREEEAWHRGWAARDRHAANEAGAR